MALTSGLRLADLVHYRLGLGARLDEIVGLRQHALAERLLVAFDDGDALFSKRLQRLLFNRNPMGSAVDRGLPRGIEETLTQLRVHPVEGGFAEVGRQRRKVV